MKNFLLPPSAFLAPYVDYYFVMEDLTPLPENEPERRVTVFPAPQGQMIFCYGQASQEKWLGDSAAMHSPDFAIGGYANKAVEYSNRQGVGSIMVGFKPWGIQAFLDFKLGEITNSNSEMSLHFGREASFVEEMLREAGSLVERIRVIEAFLAGKLRRTSFDQAMVHAVNLIVQTKGILPVEELSRRCYLSRRQFLRRFENALGISPKLFSRIVRFQRLFADLEQVQSEPEWTALAYDAGYFDQAHFINDFKDFSGMTPAQFSEQAHRTQVGLFFDENKPGEGLYGKVYL